MPALSARPTSAIVKLLLIGDSTAGKTGSLASLAADGYNLRIIDIDNKVGVLKNLLTHPDSPYVKKNPKVAEQVQVVTLTDKMVNINGVAYPARASVWQKTMDLLSNWKDPIDKTELGKLNTWGPKDVLVIDSLSMLSDAAVYFHLQMNGVLGKTRTQNEGRRDIYQAQEKIVGLLKLLRDESVACNVILISHVTSVAEFGSKPRSEEDEKKNLREAVSMETPQGYPSAIGRALSPRIPQYFPNMAIVRATGAGQGTRRMIYTQSQMIGGSLVGAMSASPIGLAPSYPIETGLADYFRVVRGG